MKMTRRVLMASNIQMEAQLAACNPESRKGLKAKLDATRKENEGLKAANRGLLAGIERLEKRVEELTPTPETEAK